MSQTPIDAIVLSTRGLVRELLSALLRTHASAPLVCGCASLEDALTGAAAARLLLCDVAGFSTTALAEFRERLRVQRPTMRVVMIDDSAAPLSVGEIIHAVCDTAQSGPAPHDRLTPLETHVMLSVAAGLRNSEIARRMRRSSKTVEKHRANALRKLGFRNVAQVTAYALHHGLLDADAILAPRGAGS